MAKESDEAGRKISGEAVRQPCTHQRVVDEFRDEQGRPTGTLICVECRAVFPYPDPSQQRPASPE